MLLYDTNIFLEILLDQERASSCEKSLELMSDHQPGFVSQFSLYAIAAILGAKKKHLQILEQFFDFVETHPHLNVIPSTLRENREICAIAEAQGLDFDDGLQYFIAKKESLVLVTLDKDFKRARGIKTLYPDS